MTGIKNDIIIYEVTDIDTQIYVNRAGAIVMIISSNHVSTFLHISIITGIWIIMIKRSLNFMVLHK
jgi:hypothetical protein